MIPITKLKPGDKARFISFGLTNAQYRRRLLALGLTPGFELSLVRVAPLGCPIQIEFRGTTIVVRKDEIAHLVVEPL